MVQRLDLEENRTERYLTGPGGACRPTPSPDGKVIAFVRRHDGHSALHLFDTESGAVRAEELAASAEELGAQAQTLQDLVNKFEL